MPEKTAENMRVGGRDGPSVASIGHVFSGFILLTTGAWAYWPTLREIVHQWNRTPDYSHGFLVVPIAVLFLWARRSSFPKSDLRPSIFGGALLLLACVLRILAGRYYLTPLDGWTIPFWVAGSVWLLYGKRCFFWSMPSIIFLWFMVPIPFAAERWLSVPAQGIATKLSTVVLQMLGQSAVAEGHTIWLGEHQLFVEDACSGLRIFFGIFALAFAFVLFSRWSFWQKLLVLVAAVPVAIIANVTRIVVTGLLYQLVSQSSAMRFCHDISGFVMIPFAAGLFWLFLIYLERLFPEIEEVAPPLFGEFNDELEGC
ncbi:MAG: exosortase/archaeosortase family protein [Pirellulales bacterium]|nr:exosortase/archaeosortase family protein [Pirellulales bacterium]